MMRKMVCSTVALFILVYSITGIAGGFWKNIDVLENDIRVVVDGKVVEKENFVYNDSTYLPLRAVAEIAGMDVQYDGDSNTAYLSTDVAGNESRELYIRNVGLIIDYVSDCEIFAERLIGESSRVPDATNAIKNDVINKQEIIDGLGNAIDGLTELKKSISNLSIPESLMEQVANRSNFDFSDFYSGMDLLDDALANFRLAQDYVLSFDATGNNAYRNEAMNAYGVCFEQAEEAINLFHSLRGELVNLILG